MIRYALTRGPADGVEVLDTLNVDFGQQLDYEFPKCNWCGEPTRFVLIATTWQHSRDGLGKLTYRWKFGRDNQVDTERLPTCEAHVAEAADAAQAGALMPDRAADLLVGRWWRPATADVLAEALTWRPRETSDEEVEFHLEHDP